MENCETCFGKGHYELRHDGISLGTVDCLFCLNISLSIYIPVEQLVEVACMTCTDLSSIVIVADGTEVEQLQNVVCSCGSTNLEFTDVLTNLVYNFTE